MCLAVICRNRSAFDMQFHLIAVPIFLETRVKDHNGDSSSRLLERRVRLVCIKALSSAEAPAGYPHQNKIIEKIESARGTMGREKSCPARSLFFFSPASPQHKEASAEERVYQSALVSGFVNILIFFNKLANNF